MLRLAFFCFLSWSLSFSFVQADPVLVNCKRTPGRLASAVNFAELNRSNDLIRKPGSVEVAEGKVIHVLGKVLDRNCVPVPNARITIFHANAKGIYQHGLGVGDEKMVDPNFRGSGMSVTDNMGNYSFVTVYPGSLKEGGPSKVHFMIKHEDFVPFETIMYFSMPPSSERKEEVLKGLSDDLAKLLVAKKDDGRNEFYRFDVTMGGLNHRLHY